MATCTMCPSTLTGKQGKYCSTRCRQSGFTAARIADGRLRDYRQRDQVKAANRERLANVQYLQTFTCERCGNEHSNRRGEQSRYCSRSCSTPGVVKPVRKPVDLRSRLRVAWESDDWQSVRALLLDRTERQMNGCRTWNGRKDRYGYSVVSIGQRRFMAYRVMATAVRGAVLSPTEPVHHSCATKTCIEPAHLQVIDAQSNVAEMLQRTYFIARIAALEAALHSVDPDHALLTELPLAM